MSIDISQAAFQLPEITVSICRHSLPLPCACPCPRGLCASLEGAQEPGAAWSQPTLPPVPLLQVFCRLLLDRVK